MGRLSWAVGASVFQEIFKTSVYQVHRKVTIVPATLYRAGWAVLVVRCKRPWDRFWRGWDSPVFVVCEAIASDIVGWRL